LLIGNLIVSPSALFHLGNWTARQSFPFSLFLGGVPIQIKNEAASHKSVSAKRRLLAEFRRLDSQSSEIPESSSTEIAQRRLHELLDRLSQIAAAMGDGTGITRF